MGPGGLGGGVGGEGRGCSIPKPLRNKIPTHSAAVWQDRRGFLEMAGWGVVPDPAPHPLPSFGAWRFICAGLSLCQEGVRGKGGVIHPSDSNREALLLQSCLLHSCFQLLLPCCQVGKFFLVSCLSSFCCYFSAVTLCSAVWVNEGPPCT